jgi:mono/diheme cytochrome c family protein
MQRMPRENSGATLKALALVAAIAALPPAAPVAAGEPPPTAAGEPAPDQDPPAGVLNMRRAWQNWTLNCQGCHRPDGTGSASTAPPLAGVVAKFLAVPGGREYLGRVPGVATSPVGNAELAEILNWMFWRFDREHIPADFSPYTAEEIGRLRGRPLRLEASQMHDALLKKADLAAGESRASGPDSP